MSAVVNGTPSDHLVPSRSCTVRMRKSSLKFHPSSSPGRGEIMSSSRNASEPRLMKEKLPGGAE